MALHTEGVVKCTARMGGQVLLDIYDRMGAGATLSSLLQSKLGAQVIMVGLVASQVLRLDTLGVQVKVGSRVKTYLLHGMVRDSRPHKILEQLKEPGSSWALEQVMRGLLVGMEESADGR